MHDLDYKHIHKYTYWLYISLLYIYYDLVHEYYTHIETSLLLVEDHNN